MTSAEVRLDVISKVDSKHEKLMLKDPIHLKWTNLNVSVDGKPILKDISGEVRPGEVLAIMGPSGAGKSTLLNLLVGRETKGITIEDGTIEINGVKATKRTRRQIGYVMQEDIFFSHLTVKETLEFVGKIRLPDTMSNSEKKRVVGDVIDDIGLRKCVDTVMGGDFFNPGCSGGEKKRCSIAVELITNPACIIMDEPTSGLDSSTALSLVATLKKLAKEENRAICMTIHQPSSHVFHMCDKLMLLCNGRLAYYGQNAKILPFFESIGRPCYENWNPADFIMEQLSSGLDVQASIITKFEAYDRELKMVEHQREGGTNKLRKAILPLSEDISMKPVRVISPDHSESHMNIMLDEGTVEFPNSDINHQGQVVTGKNLDDDAELIHQNSLPTPSKWPTGYRTQVIALSKRSFIQSKIDMWDKLSFIQAFSISIIVGLVWFNTPFDEESLQDRMGAIFFVSVYLFMHTLFSTILIFPAEVKVVAKERAAGMYRLSAYFTAKNVSNFPIMILPQLLIYTISYWMIGLNRSPVFLLGIVTAIAISLLAQSLGMLISGCIKELKKAMVITVLIALTSMLLGGFYTKRLPYWLEWSRYMSLYSYFYNILIRMELTYASKTFKCAAESAFLLCSSNQTTYLTGDQILPHFKSIDLDIPQSLAVMFGLIFIMRGLFYYVLKYFNKASS